MATYYAISGTKNWNDTAAWDLTDSTGGNPAGAIPTNAIDVVFDASHTGTMTINVSSVAKTLVIDNACTGTIYQNATLSVAGNITLGLAMTYTQVSNNLSMTNNGTLTTNGILLTFFISNVVTTLGDDIAFGTNKQSRFSQQFGGSINMNGHKITGNSVTNRVLIRGSLGTARTITNATATSFDNADFQDMSFTTAGALDLTNSGANSIGDCGGNSATGGALTFTSATTTTATGSTANWTAATWDVRVPLPQDTVVINLTAGQTITVDMPRIGKDISFSSATLLSLGIAVTSYGSVDFTGCGTIALGTQAWTFESQARSGTIYLTNNGQTMNGNCYFQAYGTTMVVDGALTLASTRTMYFYCGTLDFATNNSNVTAQNFDFSGSAYGTTRVLNMGDGVWTATLNSGTPWNATGTSLTINRNSSIVSFTDTSASNKTFKGGDKVYNNFTITGGGTGIIIIENSNTFNTLKVNAPKTITFTINTTQTINNFIALGSSYSSGKFITINSTTKKSKAYIITKTEKIVGCSFQDIGVRSNQVWDATNNCLNLGYNDGIRFNRSKNRLFRTIFKPSGGGAVNVTITPDVINNRIFPQAPTIRVNAVIVTNTITTRITIQSPTLRITARISTSTIIVRLLLNSPFISIPVATNIGDTIIKRSRIEQVILDQSLISTNITKKSRIEKLILDESPLH